MNMLLDRVPDSLEISGTRFPIKIDFRIWIQFEKLVTSGEKDNTKLLNQIFALVFRQKKPEICDEAIDQILWFYKCGKEADNKTGGSKKDVFSYDYDDGFIVAAFKEQYGINLNTDDLSWWEFHAYMLALSEDTEFVKIMGYRAVEISSKMSASQRNFYQRMKAHYELPIAKERQEEYRRIEDALLNGDSIEEFLHGQEQRV